MQTIGERLEEARKRKGVSVREAAEATKIRSDYLQKFEANSFDLDLPPLYIRGFMRSYARYLDLDQERFIAEYDSVAAAEGRGPRRNETRENFGRVEFAESNEGSGRRSSVDQAMLIKYSLYGGGAIAVIVVIVLLISLLTSNSEPKAASTAATAPSAQTAITQPQPVETAQTLAFTATDTTRLKIVQDADKRVLFDGALARGETRTFRKTGKLLITTEKGSNLRMEVNGRNYPVPLDGYGRFALD